MVNSPVEASESEWLESGATASEALLLENGITLASIPAVYAVTSFFFVQFGML